MPDDLAPGASCRGHATARVLVRIDADATPKDLRDMAEWLMAEAAREDTQPRRMRA